MKDKLSPQFIAAGCIIGLSIFVLLSMLFYGPSDYFERSDVVSAEDGLRFSVAALFYKSFGIGAYVGWAIVLAWAVIVFFREAVGDLTIRAVSLIVLVFAAAVFAEMIGSRHLGGNVGFAIGSVLQAKFGSVLGLIVIGLVFGVSLVLATEFGFVSYYREARDSLAVVDEEEAEPEAADETGGPEDLIARIDKTVREVEEEAAKEQVETVEEMPIVRSTTGGRPLVLDLKPPIEEESLDEELLVEGETPGPRKHVDAVEAPARAEEPEGEASAEAPAEAAPEAADEETEAALEVADEEAEPEPEVAAEAPEATPEAAEEEAEPEPAPEVVDEYEEPELDTQAFEEPAPVAEEPEPEPEPRPTARSLESVFDALLGPKVEPSPPEPAPIDEDAVATRSFLVEDEIVVMREVAGAAVSEETMTDVAVAEPPPEEAAETFEPEPETEEPPAATEVIVVEDPLVETRVEEGVEEKDLLPFMEDDAAEEDLPVLEDVAGAEPATEAKPEKPGKLRSIFRRNRSRAEPEAPPEPKVEEDPLLDEAARLVIERGRASVVLLQRRLDIGYTRATKIVDQLEGAGLVGPMLESGSRKVLLFADEWEERRAEMRG